MYYKNVKIQMSPGTGVYLGGESIGPGGFSYCHYNLYFDGTYYAVRRDALDRNTKMDSYSSILLPEGFKIIDIRDLKTFTGWLKNKRDTQKQLTDSLSI